MTKTKYEKVDLVATPSQVQLGTLEEILIRGDLSKLTEMQRLEYVNKLCGNHGLDPFTRPFDYLDLNGRLVLYVNRGACDQLRKIHNISITKVEKVKEDNILFVTAHAKDSSGREDVAIGAISLLRTEPKYKWVNGSREIDEDIGTPLKGNDLINVHLKAETKAKRRVTLSMGGLGALSEDDLELIEPDSSRPPLEVVQDVHAKSLKVVEEAQESTKGLYMIDGQFLTKDGLITRMESHLEAIYSFDSCNHYSDWLDSNRDGIKAFAKDHKAEYMELYEKKKHKFDELSNGN